jgi:hypothetical protein
MKNHLIEFDIEDQKIYLISAELYEAIDYLKREEKLLGIIFTENELKIVEIEDYFDIRFEKILRNNLTIILDTNVFITARSLFKYHNINTIERKYFASLLAYAMFLDAKLDPTLCMYEIGNKQNHKATDDLYKFRIVDNISLETVLKLLHQQINTISKADWEQAKNSTRELNESEINEDYNKSLDRFKQNYPFILKAAILLRMKGISPYDKIDLFFRWIEGNFITKADAITFAIYILYKDGGQIIKNHSTLIYSDIIKSIKNATWDVTMISYLKDQSKKNPDRYFLFASDDKNLINASKYFLSASEGILNLFGNKRKSEMQNIIDKMNKICNLPGRITLIEERLLNIDKTISDLENELDYSFK